MGTVLRARAPSGEEVAVKVLLEASPQRVTRFERERRLLSEFTARDGFVPLLDGGVAARGPYIVMPLLPGGTLRDRLARGPLGADETLALGRALAAALAKAHARGIVHRDLKPENVLYTAGGTPLIADLGLSKHFDRDALGASRSVALSRTGMFHGTAGYMPPEQVREARDVGPAADVFALGAILHECLAGAPAFPGENVVEVLARVESGMRERLARGAGPPFLLAAIEKALEPDPAHRFADGLAFLRALAPGPRRSRAAVAAVGLSLAMASGAVFVALGYRPPKAPPPAPAREGDDLARAALVVEVGEKARILDAAVPRKPRDVSLRVARARVRNLLLEDALERGEPAAPFEALVREDLDAALAIEPANADALVCAFCFAGIVDDHAGYARVLAAVRPDGSEAARFLEFVRAHREPSVPVAETAALVARCPGVPQAWVVHANALDAAGRRAESIAAWRSVLSLISSPGAARHAFDRCREARDWATAEEVLRAMKAAWPKAPWAYDLHYQAARALHDTEACLEDGRRVVALGKEKGWTLVAGALLDRRDPAAALAEIEAALGQVKAPAVRAALLCDRAGALAQQGNLAAAADEVVAAAKESADANVLPATVEWATKVARRLIDEQGDAERAERLLDAIVARESFATAEALRARARVAVALDRLEEAERYLARAAAVEPEKPAPVEEALDEARASVRRHLADIDARASGDERAYIDRIGLFFHVGALTRGRKEILSVLAAETPPVTRARALVLRALVIETEEKAARRLLEEALRLAPRDGLVLAWWARIELALGNKADAARIALEAVNAAPDDADVHSLRAGLLVDLGDTAGARDEAEKALALDPSCWDAHLTRTSLERGLEGGAVYARDLRAMAKVATIPLVARTLERRADYTERKTGR
jgi:tetratricopeptide (TPR) repeat protein